MIQNMNAQCYEAYLLDIKLKSLIVFSPSLHFAKHIFLHYIRTSAYRVFQNKLKMQVHLHFEFVLDTHLFDLCKIIHKVDNRFR